MHWWATTGRWSPTPIQSITRSGDDGNHELILGCGVGETRASALEFSDRIMLTAEITGSISQNECATIINVTLADPIGDRIVFNTSTGKSVKVISRGW